MNKQNQLFTYGQITRIIGKLPIKDVGLNARASIQEAFDKEFSSRKGIKKKIKKGKRKCVDCGVTGKDVTWGADPYNEDINGDDTPMWMCRSCHNKSAMDI
jgi:hypothetical protein